MVPTPSPARDSCSREGNSQLLRSLADCREALAQLHWRQALVVNNMALVQRIATRYLRSSGSRGGADGDDLVSAGTLGLIRAVERFSLAGSNRLASYAVPFIAGAIRQHLRDHWQPIHTPRRLRELQQKARRLQEQRRGRGWPPLGEAELASELGCPPERLAEAQAVWRALQVASLDQPLGPGQGSDGAPELGTLLDQLASDPPGASSCGSSAATGDASGDASCGASNLSSAAQPQADPQLAWLWQKLRQLPANDRLLVVELEIHGRGLKPVASLLGLSPRAARQRCNLLVAQLKQMANKAAMEV
jgi:RNA polymerase sigma factor (sigma-70 family)